MNEPVKKENRILLTDTSSVHGGDVYSRNIEFDFSVNINPCAEMLFRSACADSAGLADPGLNGCGSSYLAVQENGQADNATDFLQKYTEKFSSVFQAAKKGLGNAVLYPDFKYVKLRNAISRLEKVPAENIVCGNGASELFMAIVHAVQPKKALLLSPCYSGYERALKAADCCSIVYYELREENGFALDECILDKLTKDIDIFFLADPNNPTGKLADKKLKNRIINTCEKEGIILVKDECFYSLTERGWPDEKTDLPGTFDYGVCSKDGWPDEKSDFPGAFDYGVCSKDGWPDGFENGYKDQYEKSGAVLTVKAFTKSLAVPGLRIGYLYGEDIDILDQIRMHLPEWNISTVAQEMGAAAADFFAGTAFLKDSVKYITGERNYLSNALKLLGMTVYESDTNYLLAKSSKDIYRALLEKKILIRDCSNYRGLDKSYVRFAVREHNDNVMLINVIKAFLS